MRKARIYCVLTVLTLVLPASGLLAAEPDSTLLSAPQAALCQDLPTKLALASGQACKNCTVGQFSPRFGVVCTYADMCQPGANGCCEYTCACGGSSCGGTLPGTPANACALDLPTGCCLRPLNFCVKSYCNGVGSRCDACGCGVGCCRYQCGIPDSSCTGIDPIPEGAC